MDRVGAGYDEDFYAWTQSQAAELRRADAERDNRLIDWANVAEEIESMGRSQKSEIDSRLSVLLVHLLKWLFCPDLRDRCERGWRLTIREQRKKILREIKDSPSLRAYVVDAFAEAYDDARLRAAVEADAPDGQFPNESPFTLDQALDPAYPPELFPPEGRV